MRIISVDFDGTLVEDKWPKIGALNMRLVEYLKNCQKHGIKVVLNTMREGELLEDAVDFCRSVGLHFDAVNDNIPEAVALFGSNPRKIYADWYIDDHSALCGLGRKLPVLERRR